MPQQYPQYGQRPSMYGQPPHVQYGPPPVRRDPYVVAVTVLYLVGAPLALLATAVAAEPLSDGWGAVFDGYVLSGPGWVMLLAFTFTALLGLSCLSNGIVRLARGCRWDVGAWTALAFAAVAAAGLFGVIAITATERIAIDMTFVVYLLGTLIASVAGFVGAFVSK